MPVEGGVSELPLSDFLPDRPRHIREWDRHGALRENWEFSHTLISELRNRLKSLLSDNIECVALAGSFGRLEGSSASDADYIMLVKDSLAPTVERDKEQLHNAIKDLGALPPNKSGVFTDPRTAASLIDSVGKADEHSDILGKRMLLLLESRPIFGDAAYLAVLKDIFHRYAEFPEGDTSKEYAFLLNDLIRYFRYICVNYQSNFWRENEKWPIRNLKLRHSRVLMYAGLLFLLGEASKYDDARKVNAVWNNLPLTPLERLAWVYGENNDHAFFRIAGLYNVFVAKLSDEKVRTALNAIDYGERYRVGVFSELKANSDALAAELLRFVFDRRGSWSERFFEYLVL